MRQFFKPFYLKGTILFGRSKHEYNPGHFDAFIMAKSAEIHNQASIVPVGDLQFFLLIR